MKTQIEQLGKVCFTIDKNYHDINRDYDKLVIVESYEEGVAYASRKPVPAGTPLTDREYWIKFSSLKEHIQQNYNIIQQELNALYDKVGAGITFSGDYSTFDVGKSKTITLSFATVNAAEKASVVKLYQSDTLMDTYNNISEFTKEVTVSDEVTFRVVATIGNYTYSATWEVTRAYDWYIGGGANHEAVMIDANKHSGTDESISSIQSVNVNHSGDRIFICVQKDIFLPEVTMNGFTVPFDAPYTAIVDDVEYNVYKSSNAYTVNTYILKIDAANWDEDEIFRNLISVVTGFDSETEDLQNRMETAEAVYLRQGRQISSIIDRIDPLIERTGGSGDDAQPMRRTPSPWDEYRGMKHIQLLPKEEEGAVLTQEDFAEENAIYVIQYDFTLGEDITISSNCVLQFDGGSISGTHTISANDCYIIGSKDFLNCSIAGNIKNEHIYVEWFGGSDYDKISKAFALSSSSLRTTSGDEGNGLNKALKIVVFEGRVYSISQTCTLPFYCYIKGNKAVIYNSENVNSFYGTCYQAYIENLCFKGVGGSAIYINSGNIDASRLILDKIEFNTRNVSEDSPAVYLYSRSANIRIQNSKFLNCPKAVDITSDMASIDNCWFNAYSDVTQYRIPENNCVIKNSGCYNLSITNCIFVPEGDGSRAKNVRWIDHKAGHLTVYNCRFGGENSGAPMIWLYPNAISTAIHDSLVTVGPNWLGESGVIVLMNEVVPKNINLNGLQDLNGPIFSAYGYIKDNGITYSTEIEKAQAGWDAFEDYIINNKTYPTNIVIDKPYYLNFVSIYSMYPFYLNKTVLSVHNLNEDYLIGRVGYSYATGGGIYPFGNSSFKIKVVVTFGKVAFNASKEYVYAITGSFNYDITSIEVKELYTNESRNTTSDSIDNHIAVALSSEKTSDSTVTHQLYDIKLNITSVNEETVLPRRINVYMLDNNEGITETRQDYSVTLLPNKAPINK